MQAVSFRIDRVSAETNAVRLIRSKRGECSSYSRKLLRALQEKQSNAWGATLSTSRDQRRKTMPSSHSVLTSGAPSGIGAVNADCFARGGSDARPVGRDRGRTRAEFRRRIRMTGQGPANLEGDIRLEERFAERARIAHELHDKLLQGFLAASMLLHQAVEETPADSPSMPALSRALRLVRQAIDEGRAAPLKRSHNRPGSAASSLGSGKAVDTEPGNPGATLSDRPGSGDERVTSFPSDKDRG